MIVFELAALTIIGLVVVMSIPAALYVFLPQSVLASAAHHGRFAGLGTEGSVGSMPRGQARPQARQHAPTRSLDSLLAQEA